MRKVNVALALAARVRVHHDAKEVTLDDVLCAAILNRELLEFEYDGLRRVVEPYCHGFTNNGEVLRAIQVGGESRSRGMGFGKLWMVDKLRHVRATGKPFVPNDPNYNPNDRAMTSIHCAVAPPFG